MAGPGAGHGRLCGCREPRLRPPEAALLQGRGPELRLGDLRSAADSLPCQPDLARAHQPGRRGWKE